MRSIPRSQLLLALFPVLGCTSAEDSASPSPVRAPLAPVATPAADPAPPPASTSQSVAAGELRFLAQPGWVSETPTSGMRKAQFRLPGADGAADATLVVYYFGPGGGGGVEANVARWAGQFEQPDGSDSQAAMKTAERTLHGMKVTDVDLAGTYVAETSPGSGVRVREAGWRMLASILEPESGAHYVKLVGPSATVARWAASYQAFLDAVR